MYQSIYQRFKNESVNYVHFYNSVWKELSKTINVYYGSFGYQRSLIGFVNSVFKTTDFYFEYETFNDFCEGRFFELEQCKQDEDEFLEFCEVLYNLLKTLEDKIDEFDNGYNCENVIDLAKQIIKKIEFVISKVNFEFKKESTNFICVNKDIIADAVLESCEEQDYVRLILKYLAINKTKTNERLEALTNLAVSVDSLAMKYSSLDLFAKVKSFYQYCRHYATYKNKSERKWFYGKDENEYLDYVFHGIVALIAYDISKKGIDILGKIQASAVGSL